MRPEGLGKVTPRDPGPEPVDDPLDHLAVIMERPSSLPLGGRHQLLDPLPLS